MIYPSDAVTVQFYSESTTTESGVLLSSVGYDRTLLSAFIETNDTDAHIYLTSKGSDDPYLSGHGGAGSYSLFAPVTIPIGESVSWSKASVPKDGQFTIIYTPYNIASSTSDIAVANNSGYTIVLLIILVTISVLDFVRRFLMPNRRV